MALYKGVEPYSVFIEATVKFVLLVNKGIFTYLLFKVAVETRNFHEIWRQIALFQY